MVKNIPSLDELQEKGFDIGYDPTESLNSEIDARLLLDKLDPGERQIAELKYIDEMPDIMIANKLNCSSYRIKRKLDIIKDKLKSYPQQ